MSHDYYLKIQAEGDVDMRKWCQRPGKVRMDQEGNPVPDYTTEQAHKDTCNVNKIIQKYDRNGLISHVSKFEGQFGDVSGLEFRQAQNLILDANASFNALPSEIRNRFRNDPQQLLSFMDDPSNRQEAIDLGMIRADWTEATDGLGEHVEVGGNVVKAPDTAVSTESE